MPASRIGWSVALVGQPWVLPGRAWGGGVSTPGGGCAGEETAAGTARTWSLKKRMEVPTAAATMLCTAHAATVCTAPVSPVGHWNAKNCAMAQLPRF